MNGNWFIRREVRNGMTMLLVVICLIFVTGMMGMMLRQFNLTSRQRRQLEQKAQANLLAQSGIERAILAWQRDASYKGDVWQITAEELGTRRTAQVDIEVEKATATSIHISATAIYPLGSEFRAQVRKRVEVGTKE